MWVVCIIFALFSLDFFAFGVQIVSFCCLQGGPPPVREQEHITLNPPEVSPTAGMVLKRNGLSGNSPPNKKTEEADTAAIDSTSLLCISCIKDNGLLCEYCYQWEHSYCAGNSDEGYDILSDPSPNIMFFYTTCHPRVTMALKFCNKMQDKQNAFEKNY